VASKISYHHAANVEPAFATASELRDALLASYPDAASFHAPLVAKGRDDTAPAWGWIERLLKTRTDWWPALGIALQHAARDGGADARIALADALEASPATIPLLPWTEPTARRFPDATASTRATGFGQPDGRLATIVEGQRALWNTQQGDEISAANIGPDGGWLTVEVTAPGELAAMLATAARGPTADADGPWSWLVPHLIFHPRWGPWMPDLCATFLAADAADVDVRAALDWYDEAHDLWRHVGLLEGLARTPPPWWTAPAATKPPTWRYPVRARSGLATLGDVALAVLALAHAQAATPPVVDLPPLFGAPGAA
jgi:hypothetical protein